ncbi:MFS transporter [uncultured Hydrogenophaga sp.]|uniref:MFS transporter n=1 Tax=uncultured Hydrogenophaga sp. TaxID=199683 RepID=UPI002585E564|nr:MFS transporter [uncultured Hydrogenophaga sp.]
MTTVIQVLVSMSALAMPVLATLLGLHLHRSAAAVASLMAGLVYGGAMLGAISSGPLIQRWGAIRVSQVGLLLCAAGLLLACIGVLPVVMLSAFIIGLGYGPITPASSHLLSKSTPANRMSFVFSVKQTGVPLGVFLVALVAPGLAVAFGWRTALAVLSVPCVAFAVFSQRLREQLDVDRVRTTSMSINSVIGPLQLVLTHPLLRQMAACSFLFSMSQLLVTAYTVTYLHESLEYGLVASGMLLSVAQVGGVAGRIAWGYVADRWLDALRTLSLLAAVMSGCAIAMAALSSGVPALAVAALLLVFGMASIGWNGVYLAEVARRAPSGQAATATGGTLFFTFLGNVVGPVIFGLSIQHLGGFETAYLLMSVSLLFACALLYRSARRA